MSDAIIDLLSRGDLIAALIRIYTSVMGEAPFYALLLLTVSATLYIRTQSLAFVAAVWLLLWGVLLPVLPASARNFAVLMMVLAVGALLYGLFTRVAER